MHPVKPQNYGGGSLRFQILGPTFWFCGGINRLLEHMIMNKLVLWSKKHSKVAPLDYKFVHFQRLTLFSGLFLAVFSSTCYGLCSVCSNRDFGAQKVFLHFCGNTTTKYILVSYFMVFLNSWELFIDFSYLKYYFVT